MFVRRPELRLLGKRAITNTRTMLLLLLTGLCGCPSVPPPDPAVRYIAFGDSSTEGPANRHYPEILGDLLGEPAESFALEGRDGETAAEGLDRLRLILSRNIYPNAHTLLYWQGAAAVIDFIAEEDPFLLYSPLAADYPYPSQLGTMLDDVQTNIEAAIAEAHNAGLTVYVAGYFQGREVLQPCEPLFLNVILPTQVQFVNDYITLLNGRIRQAAADQGAIYVDLSAASDRITADADHFFDCRHLSAAGNAIVAEVFLETIRTSR